MTDAAVQVNLDDIKGDDETSSSGVDTASMTEKADSEVCNIGSVKNSSIQDSTYEYSFESRNFNSSQTTTEGYVAMRLASPLLPSPILDRRTIL